MNHGPLRTAVLISGRGGNLKAIIDAIAAKRLAMRIVTVISSRADAAGIAFAQAAGIPVTVINQKSYADRAAHDAAVNAAIEAARAQLIVLAGYMRILTEVFTNRFEGQVINLHPSLLPLYRGLDTYNRALQAGDQETGSSIHFVTAGLDAGPVISQVRIPIEAGDDAASLSARLGPLEHKLVVATLELFCRRRVRLEDDTVLYDGSPLEQPLQLDNDGRLHI